jgi:hypothetical protein
MANINKVNGFRPVRYLNGAAWNGQFRKYIVPASDGTAMFVGDLVKLETSGSVDGYTAVVQAAASNAVIGAVVGFEIDPADLNTPQYRKASTKRVVYVADDPNLIFEAQEDGVTTPIAAASIGLNVNVVVGSGSTVTGASGMQIDNASAPCSGSCPAPGQRECSWCFRPSVYALGSQNQQPPAR